MSKISLGIVGLSRRYPLIDKHPKWSFSDNSTLRRWFLSKMRGRILHLCCGYTRFNVGEINVDIFPNSAADIIADMFHLPFADNSFDTVVSDPPYKLAYNKRHEFTKEILRVIKKQKGSRILLKLDFIPYFKDFGLTELHIYQGKRYWAHVSLLMVFDYGVSSEAEPLEKYLGGENHEMLHL